MAGRNSFLAILHFPTFFFIVLIIPSATPLQFSFSSFSTASGADSSIIVTGNASIASGAIQLTHDPRSANGSLSKWNVGRATYSKPLRLWYDDGRPPMDFTTHFKFTIVKATYSDVGQGLAFFLAPNGSAIPPGSDGGRLGLGSSDPAVKTTFVGVEFDTYRNNEWEESLPFNHVGILIDSISSVENTSWNSQFVWERIYEAWISYDSESKNFTVNFTEFGDDDTPRRRSLHYIVDLREILPQWVTVGFSASTSDVYERNEIRSWEFSTITQSGDGDKVNVGLAVGLSVGLSVLVLAISLLGVFLWKKKKRGKLSRSRDTIELDAKMDFPKRFSHGELARATNNFSDECKLGEGGFGGVYRGCLRELTSPVAIKRVSSGSRQGPKEYVAEIRIISRLRHRNLVQLIGWCHEKGELLLVYELLANGSLDSHIYGQKGVLNWGLRYKIAKGLASGLLYLHEEGDMCVLHRDIKPSNVLLDADFNAKLGDFGLAKLIGHECASPTTDLAGTMGYMAMEYVMTRKATKESDVYSFGVVLLEIACGKRFNDFETGDGGRIVTIVDWVWYHHGKGSILGASDEKLRGELDEREMECLLTIGLWSVHPDPGLRPSVRQAVLTLNFESPLPSLPPEKPPMPAVFGSAGSMYSISSSSAASSIVASSSSQVSRGYDSSSNQITISVKSEPSSTVPSLATEYFHTR